MEIERMIQTLTTMSAPSDEGTMKAVFKIMLEFLIDAHTEMQNLKTENSRLQAQANQQELNRDQVMEYLKISKATYKRKVKDGILKPRQTAGGHRYLKSDLFDAYQESIRKGRV